MALQRGDLEVTQVPRL